MEISDLRCVRILHFHNNVLALQMHAVPCSLQTQHLCVLEAAISRLQAKKSQEEQIHHAIQHLLPMPTDSSQSPLPFLQPHPCAFSLRSVPGGYHTSRNILAKSRPLLSQTSRHKQKRISSISQLVVFVAFLLVVAMTGTSHHHLAGSRYARM